MGGTMTDELDPLYKRIDHLGVDELDALPYGAIQLDKSGRVLRFNRYESKLSGLAQEKVIGRDFFREVAPCTDVQEFRGRFERGVRERKLHEKFRYHFAFKQEPRNVLVTLFFRDVDDSVWVFVQPQ
jgi:photoactive yellow protein